MLCHPLMRRMLIARLRQVAITRGACPAVRTCDLSSSKVTSRTQWRRFCATRGRVWRVNSQIGGRLCRMRSFRSVLEIGSRLDVRP